MLDVVRGGPHIGAAPPTKLGFCSAMISLISVAEGEQSLGQLSGPEPSKSVELAWGGIDRTIRRAGQPSHRFHKHRRLSRRDRRRLKTRDKRFTRIRCLVVMAGDARTSSRAGRIGSLPYQPALDGLRGLAVAAVVLYHCGVGWARGGFLGVDVFFVLSGFLITGLLITEWRTWGSIDLRQFWVRRVRRLLPALFVLLVVLAVIAHGSPSDQRGQLRGDMLATLFYVANWHSIITQDSYFAQFVQPSPLLHTWSLAIEEQWYLIFPPLLILALRLLTTSRNVSRHARRVLTILLLLFAGLSVVLMSSVVSASDQSRAYYGTDTRAQALLVGAALALITRSGADNRARQLARSWGVPALIGLVAVFGLVPDTALWMYHGGFLLVACLSAIVVVDSCRPEATAHRILAWEPLRLLGVISYSVYLWHWPVIVYLDQQRTHWSGVVLLCARLTVMIALAIASFRLVERPVRSGVVRRAWGRRATIRASGLVSLAVIVAVVAGTSGATPSTAQQFRAGTPDSAQVPGEPLVFMVGDSVPYGLALYFPSTPPLGFAVQDATQLGCGLIPARTYAEGHAQTLLPACTIWSNAWPAQANAARPDLGAVFLGEGELFDQEDSGRVLRFGTSAYEAHLDTWLGRSVAALLTAGAARVALVTVPCHAVPGGTLGDIVNDTTRIAWVNAAIYRYARIHHAATSVVDLNRHLCSNGYTDSLDGVQLRSDGVHFTEAGSHVVWSWLGSQFRALLKAKS